MVANPAILPRRLSAKCHLGEIALNILAESVSCCSGVGLGEAAASRADGRNLKRNQRPQLGVSPPALREAPDIQNDSGTSGYPLREVGLAVDTPQQPGPRVRCPVASRPVHRLAD